MLQKQNLKSKVDSIFNNMRYLNNPGEKVMQNIHQIEQHFDVSIEKFWPDSSNECSIIIYGSKNNVGSAYNEIIKIQNDEE